MNTDPKGICLLLFLLTGCAGETCRQLYRPPAATGRPFLWEATAPERGGGTVVFYGTYHAGGKGDVPEVAWRRLEGSEVFVSEIDDAAGGDRDGSLRLPRGKSLQKLLGDDDFYELTVLLRASAEAITQLKPWVAMGMLTAKAYRFPDPSVDEALAERARARHLALEFLETWDELVAFLDRSIGGRELTQAIRDYPNMRCVIADGVAAWRAGDDAPLDASLEGAQEDILIVERNARWLPRVEGYLTGGKRAFVAVGVAHLIGDSGLPAQLAARGYTVRRFTVAEAN